MLVGGSGGREGFGPEDKTTQSSKRHLHKKKRKIGARIDRFSEKRSHAAQSPLLADDCKHLASVAAGAPCTIRGGGALACEATDIWESCGFLLHVLMLVTQPLVKHQHLTALNKQHRLEWCTSMLQRLGEAKRPHVGAQESFQDAASELMLA